MIPKKIHYCWFGGNPLPQSAIECIESWKKFLPEHQIIEWNESNFDVNCCDYVKEAYSAKKWAFVSDYARFKILYEHGGLYFDTDVEVIKPFDAIVAAGAFMGHEEKIDVNPGLGLGAPAGLALYQEIMESYHSRHFINPDGSLNLTTVVDYTTQILLAHGLRSSDVIEEVAGIRIYPRDYFCPMNYDTGEISITPNTHSIHHYSASWYTKAEEYAMELKRFYVKFLPRKIAVILATTVAKTKYEGFSSCVKWIIRKR